MRAAAVRARPGKAGTGEADKRRRKPYRAEMLFSPVRRAGSGLLYALALEHGEEAGSLVVHFLLRVETRLVLGAVVLRPRTAVVEVAPAGWVRGRRYVSGDNYALPLALLLGVGDRDCREQRGGVGVAWIAIERRLVGDLHDLAQIHHGHPVRDVLDHGEVVGYEDVGQVEFPLEVLQQVDDLRLDRDVECADRLVADDQARVERDGPRDPDPLPLAAR